LSSNYQFIFDVQGDIENGEKYFIIKLLKDRGYRVMRLMCWLDHGVILALIHFLACHWQFSFPERIAPLALDALCFEIVERVDNVAEASQSSSDSHRERAGNADQEEKKNEREKVVFLGEV
jgi:hypothetical protein